MQKVAKTRYRFVIEAMVFSMQFCLGLSWMVVSPLFPPVMDEYGIDRAVVSLLMSVVPMILVVCTMPARIRSVEYSVVESGDQWISSPGDGATSQETRG